MSTEKSTLPAPAKPVNALAALQQDLVAPIENRVKEWVGKGQLQLPPDYSVENAMKSAWLVLQTTEDKDNNPVLVSCDRNSIANALLDMAVQGLNVAKKQGYFIAYGKKLVFQRGYFGAMALAQRVNPAIAEFFAEVVYEDDELEYEIQRGKKVVTSHKQKLSNIKKDKIVAAYAGCMDANGELLPFSALMTWDEILAAWKMSKSYPLDDGGKLKATSAHAKHTAEFCKRTVINRLCKPIINASSDSNLFRECANRADRIAQDMAFQEEVAANANGEVLAIDPPESDHATTSQTDPNPAQAAPQATTGRDW